MNDNLDELMRRLAVQPLPPRLEGLEAQVQRSLDQARRTAARPSLRYAAIGLAMAAGLGVGATAAELRQAPLMSADLSGGARLAPSSLL